MNLSFFIARRYLFSRKSTNVINIISAISVMGVAVAAMAMVVTLSAFNGFQDLIASLFTRFDPPLKVVPVEGKAMPADDAVLTRIRQLPEVELACGCVEDQALVMYGDRQAMVVLKGVEDGYDRLTGIRSLLIGEGEYSLHAANLQYGILGARLAQDLGVGAAFDGFLRVYAPQREGQLDMMNPEAAFVTDSLLSPGVVFNVNQMQYDGKYLITSIGFARRMFDQQGMVSSLEIKLVPSADVDAVKAKIEAFAGNKYRVLDRYAQHADTFRIMNIEKLMAYFFLTFILMVACFNIIGSVSMLIIDKKDDAVTLRRLGMNDKMLTRVFLYEGRLIAVAGAVLGIALGLLLCWLQQTYGLVALGRSKGSFVVDAYPVSVRALDVAGVFVTVVLVGFAAVWYPVRYLSRRLL